MNITKFIIENSKNILLKDKIAIQYLNKSISYKELGRDIHSLAEYIKEITKGRSSNISIFLPNGVQFVYSYYAIHRAGSNIISINSRSTTREISHILNDSQSSIVITNSVYEKMIPANLNCSVINLNEFDKIEKLDFKNNINNELNDTHSVLYSSGTTGDPKGVILNQKNIITNSKSVIHHLEISDDDSLLVFLPLTHCFGQNFIMNSCLMSGAKLVIMEKYETKEMFNLIESENISHFFAVPFIFKKLLNQNNIKDKFKNIRLFFSAADTLDPVLSTKWKSLTNKNIYEGYGLTESSPFASYNGGKYYKHGSIGKPIIDVQMKIEKEDGTEANSFQIGEILIKGPNIMLGYLGDHEQTIIKNQWLYSGDFGYKDRDGYYYIKGRKKEMINVMGNKVWPAEVEKVISELKHVSGVAVIGIPDIRLGEKVVAFVTSLSVVNRDLVKVYCKKNLSKYKVPLEILQLKSLPMSGSGKILKNILKRDYLTLAQIEHN